MHSTCSTALAGMSTPSDALSCLSSESFVYFTLLKKGNISTLWKRGNISVHESVHNFVTVYDHE